MVKSPGVTKPVKPSKTAPALRVKLEPISPILVKVPLPLKVPFKIILLLLVVFKPTVGLLPKGIVQSLLTVLLLPLLAMVNVTRLKVILLQARVTAVPPSKLTVPPLALKSESVMVKAPPTVIVPVGAIKEPEEKVKPLFMSRVV